VEGKVIVLELDQWISIDEFDTDIYTTYEVTNSEVTSNEEENNPGG